MGGTWAISLARSYSFLPNRLHLLLISLSPLYVMTVERGQINMELKLITSIEFAEMDSLTFYRNSLWNLFVYIGGMYGFGCNATYSGLHRSPLTQAQPRHTSFVTPLGILASRPLQYFSFKNHKCHKARRRLRATRKRPLALACDCHPRDCPGGGAPLIFAQLSIGRVAASHGNPVEKVDDISGCCETRQ